MRLTAAFLRSQRRPSRSIDQLHREYAGRAYPVPAPISRPLRRLCHVTEDRVLGCAVYRLSPRAAPAARPIHIVYTHGGGFVGELGVPHWDIIEHLVRATRATVIAPLYPLAPEHAHGRTVELLERIHLELVDRIGRDRIVLCGDSAGGNLALTQALRYRDRGLPLPRRIVLFSPWLDLTLSSPAVTELEPREVMLRRAELQAFGFWWAGDEDPGGPLLSPVFADLGGLPPVLIEQGTDDLFLADARRLRDRIEAAGGQVRLHETEGGFHVFMGATFTPEARAVFHRVAGAI
jgi:acetyl esterase/lipase